MKMTNSKNNNIENHMNRCTNNHIEKRKPINSRSENRMAVPLACLLLSLSLFLAGCSSTRPSETADGQTWQEDWIQVGNFMGIEAPEQLTLSDNKDVLAAEGLYYAAWTAGSHVPYENSDGEMTELYDAQLYLLASESGDEKSAEKNYRTWLAAAGDNYEIHSKETITCNGQSYTLISYSCINEDNPYDRGVSALGVRDTHAVCAELTCVKDYDEDLEKLLTEFLNGCHYSKPD